MVKVCIIGCGGFIGSHLLERLLGSEKLSVFGIDLVSEKIDHLLQHPRLTFVKSDIYEGNNFTRWIEECDTVISLAALCNPAQYNTIPLDVIASNFTRPLRLVSLCAELRKRLIHFSTSEVYGKTVQGTAGHHLTDQNNPEHYLLSEDTTPLIMGPVSAQRWSYASAKQLLERVIFAFGVEKGLDYTIVRPFNFIGSRMDYIPGIDGEGVPRVIACFMESLLLDKPLQLVDGGKSRRVFTGIDDAVDAVVRILERPDKSARQIFNIGNPSNEVTIRDLAEMMVALFKELYPHRQNNPRIVTVSSDDFYGCGYEDCDRRAPDISKVEKLLGWKPETGLQEALRKTMISYVEYYGKECAA